MKLAQKVALNYFRAKLNLTAVFSRRLAAGMAFDLFCTPFRRKRKHDPPIFKSAEHLHVMVDGCRTAIYRWNAGGVARAMVLHGFESSARNFDRYIALLVKKGYEVIAFDAPAHGASGGKHINLPLYVKAIAAVCGVTGVPDRYLAHSFGGLAIMHYLEQIPRNNDFHVVLIAPATETTTAVRHLFRVLQLDDEVKADFEQIIVEKGGYPSSYYSIPRTLGKVHSSILWVHDEDDDVTPLKDVQPLMNNGSTQISFMITQGLGHRKIYRDNNVVKRCMEFL
ncbi:alpha/beta hydrolase [Flavihumibacter petaseus]|uniref:Serine aminopeptidase S33 domain-containing protein n=1 Tax=Flavihumibacter petaseus NBRC 106054 TaxID=1220578 RepID=A0A0E9N692_9BACT|nr:alpha/beta fold hydrolase [Flavihumibacter petaseus]GAO45328.1 hypothetical protein FPE01S_05_00250 [Flavihumibacter petaseus NBRC 106054]